MPQYSYPNNSGGMTVVYRPGPTGSQGSTYSGVVPGWASGGQTWTSAFGESDITAGSIDALAHDLAMNGYTFNPETGEFTPNSDDMMDASDLIAGTIQNPGGPPAQIPEDANPDFSSGPQTFGPQLPVTSQVNLENIGMDAVRNLPWWQQVLTMGADWLLPGVDQNTYTDSEGNTTTDWSFNPVGGLLNVVSGLPGAIFSLGDEIFDLGAADWLFEGGLDGYIGSQFNPGSTNHTPATPISTPTLTGTNTQGPIAGMYNGGLLPSQGNVYTVNNDISDPNVDSLPNVTGGTYTNTNDLTPGGVPNLGNGGVVTPPGPQTQMQRAVVPYAGDYLRYGSGPAHRFFEMREVDV